jgi:hypothetical protein
MNVAQVQLELVKAGLSVCLLLLTWFGGQRILLLWERRKKQNEIDLASLTQLHRVHSEFRTIGRLWRSFALHVKSPEDLVPVPDDVHWQVQLRAAAAEGEMEALVVKLATERVLSDDEINALGFLREAYQLLRRSIRDRRWFYWRSGSTEYKCFYTSAIELAALLSRAGKRPSAKQAVDTVEKVRIVCETMLLEPLRVEPAPRV